MYARADAQAPPYCIQVELTEGCNLRCNFCGLNGIRGKKADYKFMTEDTAMTLADEIANLGWTCRIEFAMHGEPSLNRHAVEIVDIFRQALPNNYMLMESNGAGFVKDPAVSIADMFRAGLNCLALDQYNDAPHLVPVLFNNLEKAIKINLPNFTHVAMTTKAGLKIHYYRYPDCGPDGNPHQRVGKKLRLVHILPIDTTTKGTHSTLNNHAGSGSPLDTSYNGKRCAKPFREISVRWDGNVAVCCNDWRGILPAGNVVDSGLANVWNGIVMAAARKKLYHGQRDFGPCLGCNATSYRAGLLPDHKGYYELEEPNQSDINAINRAMLNGPLVEPVLRPWEKEKGAFVNIKL